MANINTGLRAIPLGRNAKFGHLDVDTERFAANVHEHVYLYGLRQILNDAIAGKTDDQGNDLSIAQLVAKAQKRLDTLYSGELRAPSAGPVEPADPVEAEMHRMAWNAITLIAKNSDEYKSAPKGTKDRVMWAIQARAAARGEVMDRAGAIAKWLAAHPNARKQAQTVVRERETEIEL